MAITARPGYLAVASRAGMVAHVLALTAAILVLVWVFHFGGGAHLHSANKELIFNVHPLVMTLGFILVIGEGIMVYKTVPALKKVQKCVHMSFHLVALTLGIFGVYVAFKYHRESLIPDMYSLHSWLGMCTICLFGLQVLCPLNLKTNFLITIASVSMSVRPIFHIIAGPAGTWTIE